MSPLSQVYSPLAEAREEGGTPAIIESIRCGLVFHVKGLIGSHMIESIEEAVAQKVLSVWSSHPRIMIMGGVV